MTRWVICMCHEIISNNSSNRAPFFSSKHWPFGPMLSISRNVRLSVCLSVRPCVCSLLRYRLNIFLPPLPEVGIPIFLEIRKIVKNYRAKKSFFLVDFALQNMVETTLSDGLETCGRRVYR